MDYPTGEIVQLGDRVRLGDDAEGVVVCIIHAGEFSSAYPQSEWGYLKRGVLIDFPKHGLIHFESEFDDDIVLVARAVGR